MAIHSKQKDLQKSLCGTWVGIVADLTTRAVVKEFFLPKGNYRSEIRYPGRPGKKKLRSWGFWKITDGKLQIDLHGRTDRSPIAKGIESIMRSVAIDDFVMTSSDAAGIPWVHFRVDLDRATRNP